jgi:hypothetical protein
MIDKYLRKLCAQEVQIMIAKMEEDYGEFTAYHSAWGRLLEATRYLTRVEKYCVEKAKHRAARDHERKQYLGAILKQQLNPMTREELEDSGMTQTITNKAQYAQQVQMARQHLMSQAYSAGRGYQDARNIYK